MIGQTISHYKILEKLGDGGMGVVYKARDTKLDRDVALKFLPREILRDSEVKARFLHEAQAASALSHPNITKIHEIYEIEGECFICMEYVDGKTIKELMKDKKLSIEEIIKIAIQIAVGLSKAHQIEIVHRDIKSDNILITHDGLANIMDFGLAKLAGQARVTKTGSTIGTAAYMSPEQAQGLEVDHRSDIFSFGVVLFELLTGKLPFRCEHHAALMYPIINEEPQPIARFNEKVTPEIERLVAKALAKEKEERYQHSDEILADLRREQKKLDYAKAGYTSATAPVTIYKPERKYLKLQLGILSILIYLFY